MPEHMSVKQYQDFETLGKRRKALIKAIASLRLDGKEKNTSGPPSEDQFTRVDAYRKMEEFGAVPYSDESGTVWNELWNEYEHVIKGVENKMLNERNGDDGTVRVERGNASYEGKPLDERTQYFEDRPVKDIGDDEELLAVVMDKDVLFQVIRTAEEDAAREVFDNLFEVGDSDE